MIPQIPLLIFLLSIAGKSFSQDLRVITSYHNDLSKYLITAKTLLNTTQWNYLINRLKP